MRQDLSSHNQTPCGCGGGHAGCSCSCGQAECGDCETQNLVRPRYFAGQLLTEDDLELLGSYVSSKSRLHNRHLHGAGVVCGLEVTCHPCGGGKVEVHPGHALDCCGNDILVPCPKELDVSDLVRRLRVEQLGGHDCGDPCTDADVTQTEAKDAHDPQAGDEKAPASRRYCLYVRYCEQLTDPVAPYATEEPCGERPCEPTRVREGFRFELRCPGEDGGPQSLADRLRACLGDLRQVQQQIAKATNRGQRYDAAVQAIRAIDDDVDAAFLPNDRRVLEQAVEAVSEFVATAPSAEEMGPQRQTELLRRALDAFQTGALGVARYRLVEAQAGSQHETSDSAELVARATGLLLEAEPFIRKAAPSLVHESERRYAHAVLEESLEWIDPERAPEERLSYSGKLFAFGGLANVALKSFDSLELAQQRDWLLARLDRASLTHCRLRREVHAIQIGADASETDLARAEARLREALRRYLVDCLCLALQPPCPPCDDPGVLLACLTVEACKVVDVCNLERTFVLSWPAIRYWIPQLRSLGEALERACCAPRERPPAPEPGTLPELSHSTYFLQAAATYDAIELAGPLPSALEFASVSADTTSAVAGLTSGVAALIKDREALAVLPAFARPAEAVELNRDAVVTALGDQQVRSFLGNLVADRIEAIGPKPLEPAQLAELVRAEPVQAVLAAELEDEMKATATAEAETVARPFEEAIARVAAEAETTSAAVRQVERVAADAEAAAKSVGETAGRAITSVEKVERAMKSRLTATSLRETKVVKDLKSADTTLRESIRGLEQTNKEMAKRLQQLEERLREAR